MTSGNFHCSLKFLDQMKKSQKYCGPYYCFPCVKTFEYKADFLRHRREGHNTLPTSDQMGAIRSSYDNNLTYMIEHDEDQSLEIKEEIIQGKTFLPLVNFLMKIILSGLSFIFFLNFQLQGVHRKNT